MRPTQIAEGKLIAFPLLLKEGHGEVMVAEGRRSLFGADLTPSRHKCRDTPLLKTGEGVSPALARLKTAWPFRFAVSNFVAFPLLDRRGQGWLMVVGRRSHFAPTTSPRPDTSVGTSPLLKAGEGESPAFAGLKTSSPSLSPMLKI
jgi:hypothetical protein